MPDRVLNTSLHTVHIPIKLLPFQILPIDGFPIEINSHKRTLLLYFFLKLLQKQYHKTLSALRESLDIKFAWHEHLAVLEDFNAEVENKDKGELCEYHNTKSLICVSTCHKNPGNLSRIELI